MNSVQAKSNYSRLAQARPPHRTLDQKLLILGKFSQLKSSTSSAIAKIRSTNTEEIALAAATIPRQESAYLIVCGRSHADTIKTLAKRLLKVGWHLTIIVDAIEIENLGSDTVAELENLGCQLSKAEAVFALLQSKNHFIYAYAKAEVSASTVVICARTKRVLLVERKYDPFRGFCSLPGGFIRPLVETLEQCAVRELYEETGLMLRPEGLDLIGVRSNVARDMRGHVIDHCYLAIVNTGIDEKILTPGDDASKIVLLNLKQAANIRLAADHNISLHRAVTRYREKQTSLQIIWRKFTQNLFWAAA